MVGFYIRYRDGLLRTTLTRESKNNIQKSIGSRASVSIEDGDSFGMGGEFENCRELQSNMYISNKIGFFEIIVCDCGIGISKTLENVNNKKFPFRELVRNALTKGNLRNPKIEIKEKTKTGGLKLVGDLLLKETNHHFLAVYELNELLGETIPFNDNSGFIKDTFTPIKALEGLNYLLRFTIEEEYNVDNRKNWTDDIVIPFEIKKLLIENQSNNLTDEKIKIINKIPVFDYRFKNEIYSKKDNNNQKFILLLSKPKISKNDVWNFYFGENDYIKQYNSNDLTVLIADIPTFQHFVYESALIESPLYAGWAKKVKKIILIDKKLRFCHLRRESQSNAGSNIYKYVVDFDKNINFLSQPIKLIKEAQFDPSNDLSDCLKLLKVHDSKIFWENARKKGVSKNTDIAGFYKGLIEWSENQILDYYLDFNTILTDTFNVELFNILMERASFFIFKKNYEIRSFDILTKPLVQIFQSNFSTDDTLESSPLKTWTQIKM